MKLNCLLRAALVNALRVVVQHQQAVGGRVHHLHHQLEPLGRKVVAFVDEHGLVLAAGDVVAVHGGNHALHHVGHLGLGGLVLGGQRLPVGDKLLAAPLVEVAHMHAVAQALGLHHTGQLHAQRLVEAQDEDGLAAGAACAGQVFGAVAQDHGLARAGHAVDDAVAVAQAAGQLLLLDVHHAQDVGHGGGLVAVVEQGLLRLHAHLGEQVPAHAVDLRLAQLAAHAVGEHVPQAALQVFGLHGFQHFVLAQHALRLHGVVQLGVCELLAGDVGQHHAVAPRKRQLALVRACALHQLWVALQGVDHLVGVLACLLQRAGHGFGHAVGGDDPLRLVGLLDGGELPVFHLQDEDAAAGVEDAEVGVGALGAHGHVVPEQVVGCRACLPAAQPAAFRRWSCVPRTRPVRG